MKARDSKTGGFLNPLIFELLPDGEIGITPDSGSGFLGSSPSPAANLNDEMGSESFEALRTHFCYIRSLIKSGAPQFLSLTDLQS